MDDARAIPTDAELVAAANRGEAAAFETLYVRYRDWVVQLALRFTGDHDVALDVMQESFVYLLRQFPGFELRAKMKTFLYPVVRHNALAAQRSGRRLRFVADLPEPSAAAPVEADATGLHDAIGRLPALQREILVLRFADELSLSEIAEAVGVPLGTVKSRLHHALASLRGDDRLE